MMTLYMLQTVVPSVLVAWLAFAPPASAAGFWTQALATGAGLLGISRIGILAFPPWWAIYALAALLLGVILGGLARRRQRQLWPQAVLGWLSLVGFVALGLYAANESRIAFAAVQMPSGPRLELASPLAPGVYLVANGGNALSVNAHASLLDQSIAAHRPFWGTAHGVDLIALDRWGLRAEGFMPADPQRYVIFGRRVISPCAGVVLVAVDGLPDMQVPQMDRAHPAGNHVILRGADVDILLGHFRKGSLLVKVGQTLVVGEAIAQVGNSGNSSEPHLHIHAQEPGTADAPFSGAPIPIRILGRYLVRNDHLKTLTERVHAP